MLSALIVGVAALALLDASGRLGRLVATGGSGRWVGGIVLAVSMLLLGLIAGLDWHDAPSDGSSLGGAWSRWIFAPLVVAVWTVGRTVDSRSPLPSLRRRCVARLRSELRLRRPPIASLAVVLCVVVGLRAFTEPRLEYDAVSYHLPYTAAVLDTGSLAPPDTPFGDNAQAYQPKNDDLLRVLLAPLPGDESLAWIGALPHLPLLLLGVYAAARAARCRRTAAGLGALVVASSPGVLEQAASAMVDLPFASWWVAGVATTVVAARRLRDVAGRNARTPTLVAGLAFGLAFGTKYLAIPMAPIAALAGVVLWCSAPRGSALRTVLTFAVGLVVTGAFFYLRNAILTGNPIHPVEVRAFGATLLPGAYGREEMSAWVFKTAGEPPELLNFLLFLQPVFGTTAGGALQTWLPSIAQNAPEGFLLSVVAVPTLLFVAALASVVRHFRRLSLATLPLALAPLVLATCWFAVPYTYGRFAFAALAGIGVAAAICATRSTPAAWATAGAIALHFVATMPASPRAPVVITAGVVVGCLAIALLLHRRRHAAFVELAAVAAVVLLAVFAARRPSLTSHPAPNADFREGLAAVHAQAATDVIAYAGNNLPYLLRGDVPRRVVHVPIDGRTDLRFHDRARAWAHDGLPRPSIPEPGFYRRHADPAAWLAALRRVGARHLFVTRVTDMQRLTIRHDAEGFPIEAAWALAMDPSFRVLHRDAATMLFAIDDAPPLVVPAAFERREPDAATLLRDPESMLRHYPLAPAELARVDALGRPLYARLRALAERRSR
jgi:hypothetical protein